MENSLYKILDGYIDRTAIQTKNRKKSWEYGYNKDYDVVVISKDGTIGEIYEINSVKIALPSIPKDIDNHGNKWKSQEYK